MKICRFGYHRVVGVVFVMRITMETQRYVVEVTTNTIYLQMMLGKGSDVDPLVTRLLSDSYICFYQEEPSPNSAPSNILNNMFQRIKL